MIRRQLPKGTTKRIRIDCILKVRAGVEQAYVGIDIIRIATGIEVEIDTTQTQIGYRCALDEDMDKDVDMNVVYYKQMSK